MSPNFSLLKLEGKNPDLYNIYKYTGINIASVSLIVSRKPKNKKANKKLSNRFLVLRITKGSTNLNSLSFSITLNNKKAIEETKKSKAELLVNILPLKATNNG